MVHITRHCKIIGHNERRHVVIQDISRSDGPEGACGLSSAGSQGHPKGHWPERLRRSRCQRSATHAGHWPLSALKVIHTIDSPSTHTSKWHQLSNTTSPTLGAATVQDLNGRMNISYSALRLTTCTVSCCVKLYYNCVLLSFLPSVCKQD